MLVTSIFSFSHNVFYPSQNKFQFFSHIEFVVCKSFRFGLDFKFVFWHVELKWVYILSKTLVLGEFELVTAGILDILTLVPNKPWILRVWRRSFLKTLLEKEKLLLTSNFSFSHSVLYPFRELFAIFIKFEIVVCKVFQFGSV